MTPATRAKFWSRKSHARTAPLPEQLHSELNLARSGGRAGNKSCRWRDAGGRKSNGVRETEIGAVQQIEELGAELKVQLFLNMGVFHKRQVPGSKTGTGER